MLNSVAPSPGAIAVTSPDPSADSGPPRDNETGMHSSLNLFLSACYSGPARTALLRLNVGEFASVQGVGSVAAQRISGDVVLLYTLFAEHVMALRAEEDDDAPSL
jgi:hypothetical protein